MVFGALSSQHSTVGHVGFDNRKSDEDIDTQYEPASTNIFNDDTI